MNIRLPQYIKDILARFNDEGFEAFCVGGAVRDSLLLKEPFDWDITTSALPEETKKLFFDMRVIETGIKHGTVTVISNGFPVEITTYREDGAYLDSRHPENVFFTKSLKEDLARRDFTVNAIAYSDKTGLVDYFGGENDIYNSIIKTVGDPDKRFKEDALRILRALRFSATLGFKIEEGTKEAIHKNRELLRDISAERISQELTKMLVGQNIFEILTEYSDVLGVFIPEILPTVGFKQYGKKHAYDVWEHICHTVSTIPPEKDLRLTMLLHDLGKVPTHKLNENGDSTFKNHAAVGGVMAREILTRLRFDKKTVERVSFLVSHHDFEPPETKLILKHKMSELSAENVKTLLIIKKSDRGALSEEFRDIEKESLKTLLWLDEIEKNGECVTISQLNIKGSDLLKAGFRGEAIGETLERLLFDVVEEKVANNKKALLTYLL